MEIQNMDKNKYAPQSENMPTLAEVVAYSRLQTNDLLAQYAVYRAIDVQIATIQQEIESGLSAKVKMVKGWLTRGIKMTSHDPHAHQKSEVARLLQEQSEISLAMKYQNPLIWIMYKFEAYKNDKNKIVTVNDLLTHDDSLRISQKGPTICDKRVSYINRWLVTHYDVPNDAGMRMFGEDTSLSDLYADSRFTDMLLDSEFMNGWKSFENNEQGKWHGYNQN